MSLLEIDKLSVTFDGDDGPGTSVPVYGSLCAVVWLHRTV